jgi:hypothetical protein
MNLEDINMNTLPANYTIIRGDIYNNEPLPYSNLVNDNESLIRENINDLVCIRCEDDINFGDYGGINNYCFLGSVFCPKCNKNMIVPKSHIPEPYENTLTRWHILAFGLFANRPISDDEEYSENFYEDMPELESDSDTEYGYEGRSTFMHLVTNNKNKVINDFTEKSGGGVCIYCMNEMRTADDIDSIREQNFNTVCCTKCGVDAVVPITDVPEPYVDTLELWKRLEFNT